MLLAQIHQCLADPLRLRLVHLLLKRPLCVCHLQAATEAPQVVVSKRLGYLKRHGLVSASRHGNWMVYALPTPLPPVLDRTLRSLREAAQGDDELQADLDRLDQLDLDCSPAGKLQLADAEYS